MIRKKIQIPSGDTNLTIAICNDRELNTYL